MLDEMMYSVMRNLAFGFWFVVSFKIVGTVLVWAGHAPVVYFN